jgi:hypothetical protein
MRVGTQFGCFLYKLMYMCTRKPEKYTHPTSLNAGLTFQQFILATNPAFVVLAGFFHVRYPT